MLLDIERYTGPLPAPHYARFADVVPDTLASLAPPRRISVPDWAESDEGRRLSTPTYAGPWRNADAPYMVEPSRMTTSRRFSAVVFVGPARSIKTDPLVLNTFGHRVTCMPRNMAIICPGQVEAREFSITKLEPMIRACRSVAERQLKGRGADNQHDKKFAGNMRVRIGWPVIGQLSMVDIPDVLLTDYDRRDKDDVDGEGTLFDLARKRTQTFGSLGMTVAESSPGFPVECDEDWRATSPHEMPPAQGIVGLFNMGTRGRFYWTCPQCASEFEPTFARLKWEKRATNGETAKTVVMACPSGCIIEEVDKPQLNRSGRWKHETADGRLVPIDDPEVRDTDIYSASIEGPVAALQTWPQLVARFLDATEHFRLTGDEGRLKSTITLDQGRPYRARIHSIGEGLSEGVLKAMAGPLPMRVAPRGSRFITIAVDVQPNRFVVGVDAWGVGLERWLIDRFDIAMPPKDAPGAGNDDSPRAIDPARYAEDWDVLFDLLKRSWPVEESGHALKARAIIVDSHGAAGTTANAYRFWREARRRELTGQRGQIFLQRGRGGTEETRQRALYRRFEQIADRRKGRSDIYGIESGTDRLKDEIAQALTRKEPGPGAHHLPSDLPKTVIAEFCAEVRTKKGWVEKKSGLRNESLDLAVYGKALAIVLKAERIDWEAAPDWAAPVESNVHRVQADATPTRDEPKRAAAEADITNSPRSWISRRPGGWLSR